MNIPYKFNPMGVSTNKLEIVNPLCVTAINKLYVTVTTIGSPDDPNLLYSLNDGDSWSSYKLGTDINLSSGDSVLLYGQSGRWSADSSNYLTIKISDIAAISGDLSSLINYQQLNDVYIFNRLFYNSSVYDASQLILPWNVLTNNCFQSMFHGCSKLVYAPSLSANNLAENCYRYMFNSCSSLAAVPQLNSMNLAVRCYYGMFYNCTSLTENKLLPATTLPSYCYQYMFCGCKNLVSVTDLNATSLLGGFSQYSRMFYGCSSLINAPKLKATVLRASCYSEMFYNCTSLVTAPQLSATKLQSSCYNSMFYNCTNLVSAPQLPATTLVDSCYANMFYGCSKLNHVKVNFSDWGNGTPTANWLFGVAANGTFSAPSQLQAIFDASHIPVNWVLPSVTNNDLTANDSNTQYTVSQRSVKDGNQAFYAMDGDDWTYAQTQYSSTQLDWWQIDFKQPTMIYSIDIDLQNQSNKKMHFEGSNDGVNWNQIITYMNGQGHYTVNVDCNTAYRYYRFICEVKNYYLKIHEVYFTYKKVKDVPDVNSVNSFKITDAENLESYTDEYSFFIGWGKPITSYTYEKRGDNYFVQTDYQPITLAKQDNDWIISDSTFMGVQLRTTAQNPFDPAAVWYTAMGLTDIKLTFEIVS